MKITDLRTYILFEPFKKAYYSGLGKLDGRDILLVEIETDEGIVGQSFITGLQRANGSEIKVLELIVSEGLKGYLIGEDPVRVEYLWKRMYRGTARYGRKGAAIRAISVVDMALWDIIGKKANLPLWKLLGGFSESIAAYASGGHYSADGTLDDLADEMYGYVKQGFKAVKMRVGRLSLSEDTERIRVVREAIGDDIGLMVDAGEVWDAPTALKAAKRWEKYELMWLEEPVPTDDLDSLRMIRSKTSVPIALGENEYTRFGFRDLIAAGVVDILQPDVTRVGGITEWVKVANLASTYGIKVAPHGVHEIHISLAAAVDNCMMIEFTAPDYHMQTLIDRLCIEPKEPKFTTPDGMLKAPSGPGLGLKIDWEVVKSCIVNK